MAYIVQLHENWDFATSYLTFYGIFKNGLKYIYDFLGRCNSFVASALIWKEKKKRK